MDILISAFKVLEILVFIYLGLAACYVLFFGILGLFPYHPKLPKSHLQRRIAVLIPGYMEDLVIVEVAKNALEQDYPSDSYEVVIIADRFNNETIEQLKVLPVKLLEVTFKLSTKSKALNVAMSLIGDDFDVAVVLDADNFMEKGFLRKVNNSFDNGFRVVQGHRQALNMNTNLAVLDSISEEINNHIFRKGHRVLGLSSALIGSGMAFDYELFKTTMSKIKAVAGFDKELELILLRAGIRIEYLEDAIVLDEKVQKEAVFEKQRRRWLSAQFIFLTRFGLDALAQFFKHFNVDYIDKIFQFVQPPRILLLGLLTIIMVMTTLLQLIHGPWTVDIQLFSIGKWIVVWSFTVIALLLSIPGKFYNSRTLSAIFYLPRGFWLMFKLLFNLKNANKSFIHTPHGIDYDEKISDSK